MISFKKLFQSKETPDDGLTQTQREAIVDLLNYCSYADNNIALKESELIDGLETELHWDGKHSFDLYENKSVGVVRGALDSPDLADAFLKGVRARLDSEKSRTVALGLVDTLFKTDGKVTSEESQIHAAILKALQ